VKEPSEKKSRPVQNYSVSLHKNYVRKGGNRKKGKEGNKRRTGKPGYVLLRGWKGHVASDLPNARRRKYLSKKGGKGGSF